MEFLMDAALQIMEMLPQLISGMGTSIQIFAVTLIFSLPLGLIVARIITDRSFRHCT